MTLLRDLYWLFAPMWWLGWRRRVRERRSAVRVARGLQILGRLGDP